MQHLRRMSGEDPLITSVNVLTLSLCSRLHSVSGALGTVAAFSGSYAAGYSARNEVIGSLLVARLAEGRLASIAVSTAAAATPVKVSGSLALTPYSKLSRTPAKAMAHANPSRAPMAVSATPLLSPWPSDSPVSIPAPLSFQTPASAGSSICTPQSFTLGRRPRSFLLGQRGSPR